MKGEIGTLMPPLRILLTSHSANLYRQLPVPRVPENDLLVFLCSCASLHSMDASICEWAASSEGNNLYKTLLRGFQSNEIMQQTALRLLALLNFERLLPPHPDETFQPIHGCYMSDFCLHLEGRFFSNRRAIMARMALSFRRAVGPRCFPGMGRFFWVIGGDEPLHALDGLSDKYWDYKANLGLDHKGSWDRAWNELKRNLDRFDGRDRTGHGDGQQHDGQQENGDDSDEEDWLVIKM